MEAISGKFHNSTRTAKLKDVLKSIRDVSAFSLSNWNSAVVVSIAVSTFFVIDEAEINVSYSHNDEDEEEEVVWEHREVAPNASSLLVWIIPIFQEAGAVAGLSDFSVSFTLVDNVVVEIVSAITLTIPERTVFKWNNRTALLRFAKAVGVM